MEENKVIIPEDDEIAALVLLDLGAGHCSRELREYASELYNDRKVKYGGPERLNGYVSTLGKHFENRPEGRVVNRM